MIECYQEVKENDIVDQQFQVQTEQNFEEVINDLHSKLKKTQIDLMNEKSKTKSLFQILEEHKNSEIAIQLQHAEEQIMEFSRTEAALISEKQMNESLENENMKLKEKALKYKRKKQEFLDQISYLENEIEEIKKLA